MKQTWEETAPSQEAVMAWLRKERERQAVTDIRTEMAAAREKRRRRALAGMWTVGLGELALVAVLFWWVVTH